MKFYNSVRNLLDSRIQGFDFIFNFLQTINNPIIVETGCARQENNFAGDGQSSLLFDDYIQEFGGKFYTVDVCPDSVEYCKSKTKCKNTYVLLDDSICYLKKLRKELLDSNQKINFLYLDSYDAPKDNPEIVLASAKHHFFELTTIFPALDQNCLICVDDNWFENNLCKGKGQYIYEYMQHIGNSPVYVDYQIIWSNFL